MKASKIICGLFIAQVLFLGVPQIVSCQTETLDGIQYTPPQGWTKTAKEGAMVFTNINKGTQGFCILTVYASTASAGSPQKDFANKWQEFVVKPFKAEVSPKIDSQPNGDGWQITVGAAQIEMNGLQAYAVLTVFSGFGKTASVLAILNDQAYLAQMGALVESIKLDKTIASSNPTPTIQNNPTPTIQDDPFPDQPGYSPQKPLMGTLHPSITMADLVGTWDQGAGSVQRYVDSYTGDYAGTTVAFYGEQYIIKADGTFDFLFVGRSSNRTVRETDNGNVTLEGGYITFKFKQRTTHKYQFLALMTQPNGAAILSLVEVHDSFQGYFGETMRLECGHSKGYISCVGGEEWARLGARPK